MNLPDRVAFDCGLAYEFVIAAGVYEHGLLEPGRAPGKSLECDLRKQKIPSDSQTHPDWPDLDAAIVAEVEEQSNQLLDATRPTARGVSALMCAEQVVDHSEKLDLELCAFRRLNAELLNEYSGWFVAIHRGRLLDADKDEFELAMRVEPIAMREGAIAICHVAEEACEPESSPDGFAHFESPFFEEFGV